MCGRVSLHVPDVDELARLADSHVAADDRVLYRPRFNIAPTDQHWIVRLDGGGRRLMPSAWGIRAGKHLAVNARAETVADKFPYALQTGRCLVPATGFYEWSGPKRDRRPTWFSSPTGILLMAGLVESNADKEHFTILTTTPNRVVAPVHDRMPVILDVDAARHWLAAPNIGVLTRAPDSALMARPVSDRANAVEHDDADCLAPASVTGQLKLL